MIKRNYTALFLSALALTSIAHAGQSEIEEFRRAEAKAAVLDQCFEHLTNTIGAFSHFERMVRIKILDESNRRMMLPWTSNKPWVSNEAGNDIEVTSAALVKTSVKTVDKATPYTRFEDFSMPPMPTFNRIDDFRVGYVKTAICEGRSPKAKVANSNFSYEANYRFDVLAQARLFEYYLQEAKQRAIALEQFDRFHREFAGLTNYVDVLKDWAITARAAGQI